MSTNMHPMEILDCPEADRLRFDSMDPSYKKVFCDEKMEFHTWNALSCETPPPEDFLKWAIQWGLSQSIICDESAWNLMQLADKWKLPTDFMETWLLGECLPCAPKWSDFHPFLQNYNEKPLVWMQSEKFLSGLIAKNEWNAIRTLGPHLPDERQQWILEKCEQKNSNLLITALKENLLASTKMSRDIGQQISQLFLGDKKWPFFTERMSSWLEKNARELFQVNAHVWITWSALTETSEPLVRALAKGALTHPDQITMVMANKIGSWVRDQYWVKDPSRIQEDELGSMFNMEIRIQLKNRSQSEPVLSLLREFAKMLHQRDPLASDWPLKGLFENPEDRKRTMEKAFIHREEFQYTLLMLMQNLPKGDHERWSRATLLLCCRDLPHIEKVYTPLNIQRDCLPHVPDGDPLSSFARGFSIDREKIQNILLIQDSFDFPKESVERLDFIADALDRLENGSILTKQTLADDDFVFSDFQ